MKKTLAWIALGLLFPTACIIWYFRTAWAFAEDLDTRTAEWIYMPRL